MFTELFPIVATTDMSRALRFYRDILGGTVTHEFAGPDGTPVYVGIDIGATHMGLGYDAEAGGARPGPISLWIYADDCDAAIERMRANDVRVVEGPKDQPWGERVARVTDPDGNRIIIGQRGDGSRRAPENVGASLLSPEPAKYTRPEYERRFLVPSGSPWRDVVETYSKVFDDLYIRHTRLRLRTLRDSQTGREFIKLTKKLESDSPYVQMIGSIPLSPMEYEFISELEGERIRKVRYYHFYRGNVFSIDVFQDDLAGLVLCEVEAGGMEELMRVEVPDYAPLEVTEDPFFTGGNLCRTSREDLVRKLATIGSSNGNSPGA
jgi:lactoylglutathione lyase